MEALSLESGGRTVNPTYSKLAVVWRAVWMSLLTFSPALLLATLWVLRHPATAPTAAHTNPGLLGQFMVLVVFGPLIETAIFQLAVFELLRRAGVQRARYLVPVSAVLFIGIHLTNPRGAVSALTITPAGFVLAWCYLYWRRKTGSWHVPFAATWLTHGLHNFYYWLLNFVPASLIFG